MRLTFVETLVFSARWSSRSGDEALRSLQNLLLENPRAGAPIPGCGILRKFRFGDEGRGKGKRGGLRVIYLHTPEAFQIDLVTVYGKNEADNLSKAEIRELCAIAREIRRVATARAQQVRKGKEQQP